MKNLSIAVGIAASLLAATTASATPVVSLIDFDHITNAFAAPIPNLYGGLHWSNFTAVAAAFATPIGLQNAVVSTDYVAVNADTKSPSSFGGTMFTLQDAYFGAGARDGLLLNVFGVDRKLNVLDFTTLTVDTHGATFTTFNWTGLYAVVIYASGGTLNSQVSAAQDSTLFALDNLRVSNVVAEPGTLLLAGLGVGALALRRRRAA